MSSVKRTRDPISNETAKRGRVDLIARLCDLRAGAELFASKHNAERAKEKGILRARDGSAKYQELESKLFALLKDSGELEFPNEDWVFEVLPELSDLESETLDMLLEQALTHAKYEKAARELVMVERFKLDEEHERELRQLRSEHESEQTRKSVSNEMRFKQQDAEAREEQEALRQEANERIGELEGTIEELEATIEAQKEKMKEMEEEAEAEMDRLRDEGLNVFKKMKEAQEETDLKRETSRKLKEEIIDNDRLTVANLNRIKHLETQVEHSQAALDEAEAENAELRAELSKAVDPEKAEAELSALRDALAERENQLLQMSRRLSDVLDGENGENHGGFARAPGRRDSFLDRFGLGSSSKHMSPPVLRESIAYARE